MAYYWRPSECDGRAFEYDGKKHDLSHLHPFEMTHVQPAKDDKPERSYLFNVEFSLHCFTEDEKTTDNMLLCRDSRETRVFSFERYELSKHLPQIIKELGARKCFHTGKGNYFTVDITGKDGDKKEYKVYFKVARSTKVKGSLTLYVQSAYAPDDKKAKETQRHKANRKLSMPIRLSVIAYNTLTGKPIKVPK